MKAGTAILSIILFLYMTSSAIAQKEFNLSIENGLSNNQITCITQDDKGFIWLGTIDGLNRFDGHSIKTFRHDPDDITSLDDNQINDIKKDSKGSIYIITEKCVNKMLPTYGFDRFRITEKMNTGYITVGMMDQQDQLWLGTVTGNLLCLDTKTRDMYNVPVDNSVKYKDIRPFVMDEDNNLWFECDNKGLYQMNIQTGKLIWHYKKQTQDGTIVYLDNCFYAFTSDSETSVFFGGNKKFNFVTKEVYHYDSKAEIIAAVSNLRNTYLKPGQKETDELVEKSALKIANALSQITKEKINIAKYQNFCFDNSGCVWIGSQISGVYKLNIIHNGFSKFNNFMWDDQLIKDLNIRGMTHDKENKLWMATTDDGILNFDPDNEMNYRFFRTDKSDNPTSISGSEFTSVLSDKNDRIWIGGNGAVSVYDKKTDLFTRYRPDTDPALNLWSVRSLFEDSKSNVWIGFWGVAAKINTKNNDIRHYYYYNRDTANYFPGSNINYVVEDQEENLWIASSGSFKGLVFYNSTKDTFINISLSNGDVSVKTLLLDNEVLWLGTENKGLIKFDYGTLKILEIYNEKDGLPNNNICGILKDDNQNLWLSTFKGISKFNVTNKIFRNYNVDDGLQSNQFNYNSCCKLPDGRMVFGGINGFNIFHPDSIKNNPFTPKMVLTDFKVFNKPVEAGDTVNKRILLNQSIENTKELSLSYREKIFSFGFSALHYAAPQKIKYAYMLKGFEEDWNEVKYEQRFVSYSNLPAGKYTFRVKATNNDEIWCLPEDEIALSIKISPPFWKTWWFIALLIGIAILTLYFWYLRRTRRLRLQRIVLERKVKERTEEINRQKKELSHTNQELNIQKEELAIQSDNLQEANILLKEHSDELEAFSEELKAQGEELYQTNEKLIHLNATKDRFFSIIAHDLRNPFQAIINASKILSDRDKKLSDEKRKKFQLMVYDASKNAYYLLENLLEWAQSQTGNVEYQPDTIKISPIAQRIKNLLNIQAMRKNITIHCDISDNINAFADENMVETIIRNLVSNAIKFTKKGGKISISTDKKDQHVAISVSDNGVGMDSENVKNLFRIDAKVIGQGTDGENGTGLGLLISNEFAEKNGGKLEVESQQGAGSTFRLWLPEKSFENKKDEPVKRNEEDELNIPYSIHEPLLNPQKEKYQVLVVDDNPNIRKSIVDQLKEIVEVAEAPNGKEGLQKALSEIPDLVVSDIMMPEMDGFELCTNLKQDERTNHIPVILLTARVSDTSKIKGLGTGADDYLTKPFNMDVLIARIHNLLKSREKLRALFSKMISTLEYEEIDKELDKDPNKAFIQKLIGIIEENMSDPELSVESLGEKVNMSRSTLYRKLTSISDQNPGELIKTIRMKKAAELLGTGTMQVSEVMLTVGYVHGPHFSESFKKLFGVLPSEYENN